MLMLALLLLSCSSIMVERNLWSNKLYVKNVGRFSKQIVTLNYVLVVKERKIDNCVFLVIISQKFKPLF